MCVCERGRGRGKVGGVDFMLVWVGEGSEYLRRELGEEFFFVIGRLFVFGGGGRVISKWREIGIELGVGRLGFIVV